MDEIGPMNHLRVAGLPRRIRNPRGTEKTSDHPRDSQGNNVFFTSPFLRTSFLMLLLSADFATAQTPDQVNRAIDNGIAYLRSRQMAGGNWSEIPEYAGGTTALVTLALLSADVPPENETITRALNYLRRIEPDQTYVVALYVMVFAEAAPKKEIARIQRLARWLIETQLGNGRWTYGNDRRRNNQGDNSNTQFALLGLHAASQAGVEIPDHVWQRCREYWADDQAAVGSWGYTPGTPGTGSMTCAGIASLVIANREALSVRSGEFGGVKVRCAGAREDESLRKGIDWLSRFFSVRQNPGGNDLWYFYYLYGMERAGRLSGRRFFGEHDWYRAGARTLTTGTPTSQRPDGSWPGAASLISDLHNTAFSLLFLSKGRVPIIINKLRHGPGEDWNNAPNDIHNLTQFLAQQWSVRLNWQIVDGKVASAEDLLQAPILHLSGHRVPEFSPKEKQLLRQFVSDGGLLVADANCSVGEFDEGFRKLCKELFTEPGQELRRLEPEHAVWSTLFRLVPDWPLYGIDVGCRTGVFYSPDDLSCQWEFAHEESSITALRLGANIVAYAVGPEDLRDKLEERKSFENAPPDAIRRNFLQVAKIRHNGDWNPAPLAVRNLMLSLRNVAKVDVIAQERVIELLDPNLVNYPFAYMHGRTRFQFDRKEREALAEYLRNGGVLLADACCGNERFDESFRQLVAEMFPEHPLEPIPPGHELYTDAIGYDIRTVTYGPALEGRAAPPLLEGVSIDGRYVIVYSKYDLGCALQRQQSKDCKGYTHESAVRIASNVILYALKQ